MSANCPVTMMTVIAAYFGDRPVNLQTDKFISAVVITKTRTIIICSFEGIKSRAIVSFKIKTK